eukprot:IDg18170t1
MNGDMPRAASSYVLSSQDGDGEDNNQVLTGGFDTLDTLGLSKLIQEAQSSHRDENADAQDGEERDEDGSRGLRRRKSGARRAGNTGNGTGLLRKAEVAARDVTKWVIGISMFLVAGCVTWMLHAKFMD